MVEINGNMSEPKIRNEGMKNVISCMDFCRVVYFNDLILLKRATKHRHKLRT